MGNKRLIPPGIKDQNTEALNELIDRLGNLDLTPLLIYIIDNVPASALSHLAWQFHIEGWELARTEEEKRSLIKRAIELHRYKGTVWAIKKVLETFKLEGEIHEWFQYGGQPYRFKVNIISTEKELNVDTVQKLYNLINEYKNVRSWLEDLILTYRNNIGISYQTSGIAESFAEALLYFTLEHSAQTTRYYQTAGMAEAETHTEHLREFTFTSKMPTWYQTACMGESYSYTVMQ